MPCRNAVGAVGRTAKVLGHLDGLRRSALEVRPQKEIRRALHLLAHLPRSRLVRLITWGLMNLRLDDIHAAVGTGAVGTGEAPGDNGRVIIVRVL